MGLDRKYKQNNLVRLQVHYFGEMYLIRRSIWVTFSGQVFELFII